MKAPRKPDTAIYLVNEHDGEEVRRAIRISTLRLDFLAAATFVPRSADTFSGDWGDWLDGRWTPFLAGHVARVYTRSRASETDEIVRLDRAAGDFLDVDEAERSLAAGSAMREAAESAQHSRVIKKFFASFGAGEKGGHAATVLAMQAAEFNLPIFSVLISYLYFEWKSGALRVSGGAFEADETRFTVDAVRALGGIRELLQRHLGEFDPAACA